MSDPQQAAEARLRVLGDCLELQEDGVPAEDIPWPDDLQAPYCGCDTCMVREVLVAAWAILQGLPVVAAPEAKVYDFGSYDSRQVNPAKDWLEAVMREYLCERCKAPPGSPCRTTSGSTKSRCHAARYRAAVDNGRLPRVTNPRNAKLNEHFR